MPKKKASKTAKKPRKAPSDAKPAKPARTTVDGVPLVEGMEAWEPTTDNFGWTWVPRPCRILSLSSVSAYIEYTDVTPPPSPRWLYSPTKWLYSTRDACAVACRENEAFYADTIDQTSQ